MENVIEIIGVIGVICTITAAYLGYRKGALKDSCESGKNNGSLMSDIGYIKAGVDDLKRKQETAELRHYTLVERVTKVETVAELALKGVEEIKRKE